MRTSKNPHWLFWLGLCTPGILPWASDYLPFQDWPGHLGVVGVILHYSEVEAQLPNYFELSGGAGPNALMYWMISGLANWLPPMDAGRVVLSLALGGLGPAMAWLCRSVGSDIRLAYLVLPLSLGRHVYCGFMPNACALVTGVCAMACYFQMRARQSRVRTMFLFLGFMLVTHSFHVFVFLVVWGLLLAVSVWDCVILRTKKAAIRLSFVLVTVMSMLPHWLSFEGRSRGNAGAIGAIYEATISADRTQLFSQLWNWLFASYRYSLLDDVLQAIWLGMCLVGLVIFMMIKSTGSQEQRQVRNCLWLMFSITAFMFVLLPSYIGPPVNWWGGNLRLPIFLGVLLIPLVGTWFDKNRLASWSLYGVNLFIVALAVIDIWNFGRTEMKGFEEVIKAVPAGKRLTLLHWTPTEVHEYPGEPHGYASNYYLLEKGGFVPQNVFEHPDVLVQRKVSAPAPPWGQAEYFDWNRHSWSFDAFVVRRHAKFPDSPLHGINQTRVELVHRSGEWSYYRRR